MGKTSAILIITTVCGLLIIISGFFISIYPRSGLFLHLNKKFSLTAFINSALKLKGIRFLIPPRRSRIYTFSEKILKNSETSLGVEALFLAKYFSFILIATIVFLISYTNIDIIKSSIISKPSKNLIMFDDSIKKDYNYSLTLYNAVLERIGKSTLQKLDERQKLEAVKNELSGFSIEGNKEELAEKARSIVNTFNQVEGVRLIGFPGITIIAVSFWLPEVLLLMRWLLLSSGYKKEVIKLESVFELLGKGSGFRTVDIIEQMEKASKVYRKHLSIFKEIFKRDRETGLETIKQAVRNKRFSRLMDVLRIYSLTDRELAVEILERNRLEKEEQIFLTAEEDVDMVDIVAFASIVPILWELSNLLMKPMLDMIFEAFRYV